MLVDKILANDSQFSTTRAGRLSIYGENIVITCE